MNQRTLNYLLVGSITLNAFLLGVFSMHYFSKRGMMHERSRRSVDDIGISASIGEERGPRLLRGLVRAAGGPNDPRVQALWSGHRQQLAPLREEINASRDRVRSALGSEPFDDQALRRALDAALAARHRADQMAISGAVELAAKMTPEERAKLRQLSRTKRPGRRSEAE